VRIAQAGDLVQSLIPSCRPVVHRRRLGQGRGSAEALDGATIAEGAQDTLKLG